MNASRLSVPFAVAMMTASGGSALAQAAPDVTAQEVLIKSTLMTFNDANVTNNYDVFHAKLSKPFRDQFSTEKLKGIFKSFIDQHIDFDIVVAKQPIPDQPVAVDDKGTLKIYGHFDTKPNWVTYKLDYIRSEGEWKIVGIDVKLAAPPVAPEEKSQSQKMK